MEALLRREQEAAAAAAASAAKKPVPAQAKSAQVVDSKKRPSSALPGGIQAGKRPTSKQSMKAVAHAPSSHKDVNDGDDDDGEDDDEEDDEELEENGAVVPDLLTDPASGAAAAAAVGRRVVVEGMVSRRDLNGGGAVVVAWHASERRWELEMDKHDELVLIRSCNLRWLDVRPGK